MITGSEKLFEISEMAITIISNAVRNLVNWIQVHYVEMPPVVGMTVPALQYNLYQAKILNSF